MLVEKKAVLKVASSVVWKALIKAVKKVEMMGERTGDYLVGARDFYLAASTVVE